MPTRGMSSCDKEMTAPWPRYPDSLEACHKIPAGPQALCSKKRLNEPSMPKPPLDKDLKKVSRLEAALHDASASYAAPGLAAVFMLAACIWAIFFFAGGPFVYLVVIASVISAYMALNVGANDVANNMGPAVGGRALTMAGALAIAAVCEAAGALLAGGDVVTTVSRDLITPGTILSGHAFILIMIAASLAAAMWIHLATFLNAPVSTTHAVVGGVVGAGIVAAGFSVVSWGAIGTIVASWVISPVMGGILAALLLAVAELLILRKHDKIAAARRWVPVFVALMTGVFALYIAMKGLKHIWAPGLPVMLLLGLVAALAGYFLARPWIAGRAPQVENRPRQVAKLFRLPLILATGVLSFAHGANDVANAVGPLAAIVSTAQNGHLDADKVTLPIWVLAIGAIGIAVGLALFGPRLIRTVGERITRMNELRAYCVALSAAITVLVASALGLPVSSTHIAVGAVFGVGLLREFHWNINVRNPSIPAEAPEGRQSLFNATAEEAVANMESRMKRRLVRRQHAYSIAAAWVITVPAAALLSAGLYLGLTALTAR